MSLDKNSQVPLQEELSNSAVSNLNQYWDYIINTFVIPFGHHLISFLYSVYLKFTPIYVVLFLIKTVPMIIYMHKFVRNVYTSSSERLKQRKIELADIQLQIQIVNTKISVRDSDFSERVEQLRRNVEKLRLVRSRVREIITTDEELRRKLNKHNINEDNDSDINLQCSSEEECEFIVELLKELKSNQVTVAEWEPKTKNCGQHSGEPLSQESSVYSSISDTNTKQDCHVKIVKVTNVYKVAYLKHYIKQKRLRRATKQAMLKKKMENVKKLLDDWQNTLNMVINNKLSLLNRNSYVEVTPHEAMGDCSQANGRDFSDSDSDFRYSFDNVHDDTVNWNQNTMRTMFLYEDTQYPKGIYEPQDTNEMYHHSQSDCTEQGPTPLVIVPEETTSQLEIEEIESQEDEAECRDIIAM